MKRVTTGVLVSAFIFAGVIAVYGKAQALELKYGHVGAPGSLFQICVDEFAKRANAKLGDKATVTTFGSSQLGKDREIIYETVHVS